MKTVNIMKQKKLKAGDYIYLKYVKSTIKMTNMNLEGDGNDVLKIGERFATKEEIKKYNENS